MSEFNFRGPVISSAPGAEIGLRGAQQRFMMKDREQQRVREEQKQDLDTKTSVWGYISKRAGMVYDEPSYQAFRRDFIQGGFVQPQDLPEQYSPQVAEGLQKMAISAKDRASLSETERHHKATEGIQAQKSEAGGGPKAAEYNAVYSRVVGLFGGTYDPVSGRISGLSRDKTKQVQSVTARAESLYRRSGNLTPAEAVSQAAKEAGITFSEEAPQTSTPPPNQRKAGQIYQTPKGPMKWSGTGWIPQ